MADVPRVRSTQCTIDVQTPQGVRLQVTPDQPLLGSDLVHVHTHNDMAESCGTFQLTFAPREVEGKLLDERLPLGSLLTIRLQDAFHPVDEDTAVVMLGRSEEHHVQEDYSRGRPERRVVIRGRSPASALIDTHLWYHPAFARQPDAGTLTSAERTFNLFWINDLTSSNTDPRESIAAILHYMLGLPSRAQGKTTGVESAEGYYDDQGSIAALMAKNPTLSQEEAAAQVTDASREQRVQESIGTSMGFQPPGTASSGGRQLAQWGFQGITLADLLAMNNDTWTLFDDTVKVPITSQTAIAGSIWNYLHLFIDRLFQEFFTRIQSGVCRIYFRPKPFLRKEVLSGTRFTPDDTTLGTLALTPDFLVRSDLRRSINSIYNVFRVLPLGATPYLKEPSVAYRMIPTIFKDPDHASYVGRWGMRLLDHASPYLSGLPTIPSTTKEQREEDIVSTSTAWSTLASQWYGGGPDLYAGMLTVLGSPLWNCGHRLLMQGFGHDREGYIEGVDHDYTVRTGVYLTHLRTTRLWYLDGPVDERINQRDTTPQVSM